MNEKIPISKQGFERLKDVLKQLKTVERRKASEHVGEAASHGDLTENAEYDAAKEAQAHNAARTVDLEGKLAQVRIIEDENIPSDKIG